MAGMFGGGFMMDGNAGGETANGMPKVRGEKERKTRVGEKENSTCMREQSLLLLVMVAVEILRHQT